MIERVANIDKLCKCTATNSVNAIFDESGFVFVVKEVSEDIVFLFPYLHVCQLVLNPNVLFVYWTKLHEKQ